MSRALETRVRCAAYQVEQCNRVLVAAVGRVLVARGQELREPPRLLALARALAHRRRDDLEVLGGGGGGDGGKRLLRTARRVVSALAYITSGYWARE